MVPVATEPTDPPVAGMASPLPGPPGIEPSAGLSAPQEWDPGHWVSIWPKEGLPGRATPRPPFSPARS